MRRISSPTVLKLPLLGVLTGLVVGCGGATSGHEEPLLPQEAFQWTTRERVHAFYSGHSLSDGVPEAVARIAAGRGQTLEFEFQSAGYSLLRERTKGAASSPTWDGYRTGLNRRGSGLDVALELLKPSSLSPGSVYDAVVITERHDLPWTVATEGTATYLADFAQRAWSGNPAADVFLYHTWLAVDLADPLPWIRYELQALRLWECVASRANRDLNVTSGRRIRVLPGGAALAALTERLWVGQVPGVSIDDPSARVRLLFADDVHLSAIGKYYMGLVHYAVLFGQPPRDSQIHGVSPETVAYLERFAHDITTAYARVADAASRRNSEACRTFAVEMCDASYRLPARGWRDRLSGPYRMWSCRRLFADPDDPGNPFKRD